VNSSTEREALDRAIAELVSAGFSVVTESLGENSVRADIAEALSGIRVDIMATRGAETVIGEVVRRGSRKQARLVQLATAVESLNDVRLEVIWVGDLETPPSTSWIVELAQRGMAAAEKDEVAGILVAWSAFEGAAAIYSYDNGIEVPHHGQAQIAELYSRGLITNVLYQRLRKIAFARNSLAHGRQADGTLNSDTASYVSELAIAVASGSLMTPQQVIDMLRLRLSATEIATLAAWPESAPDESIIARLGIDSVSVDWEQLAEIAGQAAALAIEDSDLKAGPIGGPRDHARDLRSPGGTMASKFEIYRDQAGKFRFRLKASNGQIVATGEAYETRAAAKEGCESVLRAAASAQIEEVEA